MAIIWTENFESATGATSQAGVTRNAPNRADTINGDNDLQGDFSFRSDQPDDGTLFTYPFFFTGLNGFGWLVEDTDAIATNPIAIDQLDWTGIDISGETELFFEGAFGAYNNSAVGAYRWDDDDFVSLQVQIDGGGFVEILRFESDNIAGGGQNSGDLRVDTNGDGIGDGALISLAMENYKVAISGTGTTLDLRLTFQSNAANENIAFDDFSITDGVIQASFGEITRGTDVGETINGTDGNDVIAAYGGIDSVNGLSGNDRLFGMDGGDALNGGSGNDQLWGMEGADALNGGTGFDTAYYTNSTAGVALDVTTGGTGGDAAGDTFTSIERFVGSRFNDILDGGNSNDILYGYLGNDIMNGGGGLDTLHGQDGDDTINGGSGSDRIYGGDGNDILNGGSGNDRIFGGDGTNTINGDAGNDTLFGGSGADAFDGGEGVDRVLYSTATSGVHVFLSMGGSTGDGDAFLDTFTNVENIYGTHFNDIIVGDGDANLLVGLDGNDQINGDDGNDRLIGGDGSDRLEGGNGNDTLVGQAGSDTFVFSGSFASNINFGIDRIIDFTDGVDIIEFESVSLVMSFDFLTLEQVGNDVHITEDESETGVISQWIVVVKNSLIADFSSADFTFTSSQEPLYDKDIVQDPLAELIADVQNTDESATYGSGEEYTDSGFVDALFDSFA